MKHLLWVLTCRPTSCHFVHLLDKISMKIEYSNTIFIVAVSGFNATLGLTHIFWQVLSLSNLGSGKASFKY